MRRPASSPYNLTRTTIVRRTHTRTLLTLLVALTCLLTFATAQITIDTSSTGIASPDNFNPSDIPLTPPANIVYGSSGCQFIQQWGGPQCPGGTECTSDTLATQQNDGQFHLTYQQEQCLFCIFSSYCSPKQKDQCKQLSLIEPDFNVANIVNKTLGVGTCHPCKEGQYCPLVNATSSDPHGSINPFGLAIINLCAEGSYCPTSVEQLSCPVGFFCPMGTKFPFACTTLGTFCAAGSTSPSTLCPGGSYCPDPSTQIECPSGSFCKSGAIAPKKCTVLASCPAGSAAALLVWQGIIFVILIYLALAAVYYTTRFIQKRRRKREAAAAAKRAEGAEVVQLLKSLRTFQNIEAMHAQQVGMTPYTGRGRNGYTPYDSSTPLVSTGRGLVKPAAGGAFGAGMHGGDGARTPEYGISKDVTAPEEVDYTIAKTVDDGFAVVKHSKEPESALVNMGLSTPKDQPKEEVIGVVSGNKNGVHHEKDSQVAKAENHEDVGVVMPEKSAHQVVLPESAQVATGQTTLDDVRDKENGVASDQIKSTPRNIPSAIDVKTDADIDTGAAVRDGDGDDDESVDDEDDEDDDLTGFDPIPIPVTLTFDELGLKLDNGTEVLKGVSGEFPHSRLTALMGPSGAGKSTFLNVLCGKASYGQMTGSIQLNDVPTTIGAVKSVTGFVPQDDVMHADLTCYENLYYNAMLRLPRNMPYSQKKQIIEDTVKMLGLEAVQHSVVGSVENRGISGGQLSCRAVADG